MVSKLFLTVLAASVVTTVFAVPVQHRHRSHHDHNHDHDHDSRAEASGSHEHQSRNPVYADPTDYQYFSERAIDEAESSTDDDSVPLSLARRSDPEADDTYMTPDLEERMDSDQEFRGHLMYPRFAQPNEIENAQSGKPTGQEPGRSQDSDSNDIESRAQPTSMKNPGNVPQGTQGNPGAGAPGVPNNSPTHAEGTGPGPEAAAPSQNGTQSNQAGSGNPQQSTPQGSQNNGLVNPAVLNTLNKCIPQGVQNHGQGSISGALVKECLPQTLQNEAQSDPTMLNSLAQNLPSLLQGQRQSSQKAAQQNPSSTSPKQGQGNPKPPGNSKPWWLGGQQSKSNGKKTQQ
ncbi:MAG: hypothetical protein M1822_008889 [Bathelium mastoideum]|nr:MAG: hypothetical protein M1822_008889 [Bathelium mastoideum]